MITKVYLQFESLEAPCFVVSGKLDDISSRRDDGGDKVEELCFIVSSWLSLTTTADWESGV